MKNAKYGASLVTFLEAGEALRDAALDDEVLKAIPVVGMVIKLLDVKGEITNRLFLAKVKRFADGTRVATDKSWEQWRERIRREPSEATKLGEVTLFVLHAATSMEKCDIAAKLFVAMVDEVIDREVYERLLHVVHAGHLPDLTFFSAGEPNCLLVQGPQDEFRGEFRYFSRDEFEKPLPTGTVFGGSVQFLLSQGLLAKSDDNEPWQVVMSEDSDNNKRANVYEFTSLGNKLWRALNERPND